MFDVGFWELALIFMLGLIVLGPEKLPRIAAKIGRWVGRARRTATQLRYQLEREINLDDRPRRSYTPPPKTSQIVPPPGTQRDESGATEANSRDAGESAGTGQTSATGGSAGSTDDNAPDTDRDTGT